MMHKYRRLLRSRAIFSLIQGLVILFVLLLLIVGRNSVPSGRAIFYSKAPGHILVQLAELPEPTEAETHTVAQWTLFGDGTLIFPSDPGNTLWRAHLSPSAIQHILDVIINQYQFFAISQQRFSRIIAGSDDNELLLTVDASGQQKEATLMSELPMSGATDIQTRHVFAIETFLLNYHPLHAVLYAPNPDPDGDGDVDTNNGN